MSFFTGVWLIITNRRDETDDLGTSTFASLLGASLKEARIPALSICSSNSCVSDRLVKSFIIQGWAVPKVLRFAIDVSLMEAAAAWSTGLPWESDLERWQDETRHMTNDLSAVIHVWRLLETWHGKKEILPMRLNVGGQSEPWGGNICPVRN